MKVKLIANLNRDEFCGEVETSSETIGDFISDLLRERGIAEDDIRVRVNRSEVLRSYALREGDRITVCPSKIQANPGRPPFRCEFQKIRKEDQEYFLRLYPHRREEWTA